MGRTSKTRRAWQVFAALLAGVLAPRFGNAQPEEKLLTEVARPAVVKIPMGGDKEGARLSARQVLLITTDEEATAGFDVLEFGKPDVKNWKGSADLIDTRTGMKTHLAGLTRLLHRTTVTMGPDFFEASPDSTWVFWSTYNGRINGADRHAALLDGTHYQKWHLVASFSFFLDAHHVVEMADEEPVLVVRDLRNPNKTRTYRTAEQAKAVLTPYAAQHPVFVEVSTKYGIVPRGHARITTYRTEDRLQWLVHDNDPTRKAPQAVETHEIKLLEGASVREYEVSPDQKSIVYYLEFAQKPPPLSKPGRAELWVSQADGQGLHEIGYVLAGLDKPGDSYIALYDVHWLPEGKQISFFYQDTYYLAEASTDGIFVDGPALDVDVRSGGR